MAFINITGKEDFMSRLFIDVEAETETVKIKLDEMEVPYQIKGTYMIIPRILNGEKDNEGKYSQSALVTHGMLLDIGIDLETLFDKCRENSKKMFPGEVLEISEYLSDTEVEMAPDGIVMPQIYVLSNSSGMNGAAAFFYQPELVENLASMIGKDLLIFPAGKNEMFFIPVSNSTPIKELQDMYNEAIKSLNAADENPLASDVMQYDHIRRNVRQIDGSVFSLRDETASPAIRHTTR